MTKEELKSRVKQLEEERERLIEWLDSKKNDYIENIYNDYMDAFSETIEFIEKQKQMDLLKRPGTLQEDPNQNPHSKYRAKTTTITKEVNKRGKV